MPWNLSLKLKPHAPRKIPKMQQPQTLTSRDVPRLIEELLRQVQSETRRPVSADVLRLSDAIEAASASMPQIHIHRGDWAKWGLSSTEAQLASILKARAGQTVTRETLMQILYGDDRPDGKILDVFVSKTRKKLAGYYEIEPDWGVGYRMVYLKKGRDPCDVIEWRGIFMGIKQSLVAEYLHASMNRWTHTRDLARAANTGPNAVGSIMRLLKRNLLATPYRIENHRNAGYRMVRSHAP